jgi:hypothetical protein
VNPGTWLRSRAGWIRVLAVLVYAVAMGYAETAAVIYIRLVLGGVDPLRRIGQPPPAELGVTEVGREIATIVMLATVAIMAGRGWAGRWGAFVLAFGVWDITYYAFFALLTGWPVGLLEWDILFLIPLPWWGPVIAPMMIAAAMAISGVVFMLREAVGDPPRLDWRWSVVGVLGALLCLYVFMLDAIGVAGGGLEALRTVRPTVFHWPLFLAGYLPLAAGFLGTALVRRAGPPGPAANRSQSAAWRTSAGSEMGG